MKLCFRYYIIVYQVLLFLVSGATRRNPPSSYININGARKIQSSSKNVTVKSRLNSSKGGGKLNFKVREDSCRDLNNTSLNTGKKRKKSREYKAEKNNKRCCVIANDTCIILPTFNVSTAIVNVYPASEATSSNTQCKLCSLEELKILYIPQKDVKLYSYLDSGRHSTVFKGIATIPRRYFSQQKNHVRKNKIEVVVKVLKSAAPISNKVYREITILQKLSGLDSVVHMLGVTKSNNNVAILFDSLGSDFKVLDHPNHKLTKGELKIYMYKLLKALEDCHSEGIIHRDIKSRNILFNKKTLELRLLDFGLSDYFAPNKKFNPRVASRHYKCPELLLHYCCYDFKVDIWSAGCVFAGLLFLKNPFFYNVRVSPLVNNDLRANLDQLSSISSIVGSNSILNWAKNEDIKLSPQQIKAIGNCPPKSFQKFTNKRNEHLCKDNDNAMDLLSKMLEVDHRKRFTASQCLHHKYFD